MRPNDASKRGQGKPETFNFLGFTHYCGNDAGRGRSRSNANRLPSACGPSCKRSRLQLQRRMHGAVAEVGSWLRSVVQGWFNYHAVPGNFGCLDAVPHPGPASLAAHPAEAEPERAHAGPGSGCRRLIAALASQRPDPASLSQRAIDRQQPKVRAV